MPDTTPNTEQEAVSTPPIVEEASTAASTPEPQKEEKKKFSLVDEDTAQSVEKQEDEEQEEQDVPRTEFMNLKEALVIGQAHLKRIPHINPESLRKFLLADLYPIIIEIADYSNWYVGDLHNRVMGIEMGESEGYDGESLSPETAEQLINFIGMSLQIFGVILQSPKADPRLIQTAQLLTTQAPGLIAKLQDITMSEDSDEGDEEEEEYEDEEDSEVEPTEVLEPQKREPIQVTAPESDESEKKANGANGTDQKAEPAQEVQTEPEASEPVTEPAESTGAEDQEGKSDA
jgi:hypothetical protein